MAMKRNCPARPLAEFKAMMASEVPENIVHLAASPEVAGVTGQYFNQSRAVEPSQEAQDYTATERLGRESERLAGVNYGMVQR